MPIIIKPNMIFPPNSFLRDKMLEHACWYSGDAELLANFYANMLTEKSAAIAVPMANNVFWSRQLKVDGEVKVHVPIAGDIATVSSDLLFAEAPIIRVKEYDKKDLNSPYKKEQENLNTMIDESFLISKLTEASEACAAIGGVYIKLAWDDTISEYPIPVIVQADRAIPDFKFGNLNEVLFWKVLTPLSEMEQKSGKVYRLLEKYMPGKIEYSLWVGNDERLGTQVSIDSHPETEGMQNIVDTGVDKLLAVFIPNKLPNKLDRNSSLGCSDYLGVEGLMDSLDEIFTNWTKEVSNALGKTFIPEAFLEGENRNYNRDKTTFVKLNVDPVSADASLITPQQFAIRAAEFEKTAINFIERIVSSAGYSPQTFGISIEGRAESGTALSIREGKSYKTKNKKEKYWARAIKHLVTCMVELANAQLSGNFADITIAVEFPEQTASSVQEVASSVKMISDATAASIATKVRMLHPDWSEQEVMDEVAAIKEENSLDAANPDALDMDQLSIGSEDNEDNDLEE